MRVLIIARAALQGLPAGDTTQVLETAGRLRSLGVDVDLEPRHPMERYDLVHVFNVMAVRDVFPAWGDAVRRGLPVVVSPLYWNPAPYWESLPSSKARRLRLTWEAEQGLRREILAGARLWLPNARAQLRLLEEDFGLIRPHRVVPSGAGEIFARGSAARFRATHPNLRAFVLCVGRIDPQKNQLSLIRALRGTGLPLVLVGPPGHGDYYVRCLREAGPSVKVLAPLSARRLADAYAAARVHALPSWFETPGLASLEAGLAGCNVVVGDRGTEHEYFGNLAWYCDPASETSIRSAVLAAYGAPPQQDLRRRVAATYTWEEAARQTLQGYLEALNFGQSGTEPG